MKNLSNFKTTGSYVSVHSYDWEEALLEQHQQELDEFMSALLREEEFDVFLEDRETEVLEDLCTSSLEEMPDDEEKMSGEKIALIKKWAVKRPDVKFRRKQNHRCKHLRQKSPKITKDGRCPTDNDSLTYAYASSHTNTFTLRTKRDEDVLIVKTEDTEFTPYPGKYYQHESVRLIVEANNQNYIGVAHLHGTSHKFRIDLRVA